MSDPQDAPPAGTGTPPSAADADGAPSGTDAVHSARNGAVTTITLSRPAARNAVDGPTATALADAFRAFEADEQAAVAVLFGAGGTFCSGADLKAIGSARGNRLLPVAEAIDAGEASDDATRSLGGTSRDASDVNTPTTLPEHDGPMGPTRMRLSKPVVAAIAGYAVAGGLELALWCDLRVVEEDATFGVFCRRWGVPLIDGGTVRLPRLIGASRALDLVLTGRPVAAEEALQIGLANRVVPAGQALPAAQALAAQIAAFPQTCLRHDRLSLLEQDGLAETAALANELRHGGQTLASGETLEGATRFRQGAGRGGAPA